MHLILVLCLVTIQHLTPLFCRSIHVSKDGDTAGTSARAIADLIIPLLDRSLEKSEDINVLSYEDTKDGKLKKSNKKWDDIKKLLDVEHSNSQESSPPVTIIVASSKLESELKKLRKHLAEEEDSSEDAKDESKSEEEVSSETNEKPTQRFSGDTDEASSAYTEELKKYIKSSEDASVDTDATTETIEVLTSEEDSEKIEDKEIPEKLHHLRHESALKESVIVNNNPEKVDSLKDITDKVDYGDGIPSYEESEEIDRQNEIHQVETVSKETDEEKIERNSGSVEINSESGENSEEDSKIAVKNSLNKSQNIKPMKHKARKHKNIFNKVDANLDTTGNLKTPASEDTIKKVDTVKKSINLKHVIVPKLSTSQKYKGTVIIKGNIENDGKVILEESAIRHYAGKPRKRVSISEEFHNDDPLDTVEEFTVEVDRKPKKSKDRSKKDQDTFETIEEAKVEESEETVEIMEQNYHANNEINPESKHEAQHSKIENLNKSTEEPTVNLIEESSTEELVKTSEVSDDNVVSAENTLEIWSKEALLEVPEETSEEDSSMKASIEATADISSEAFTESSTEVSAEVSTEASREMLEERSVKTSARVLDEASAVISVEELIKQTSEETKEASADIEKDLDASKSEYNVEGHNDATKSEEIFAYNSDIEDGLAKTSSQESTEEIIEVPEKINYIETEKTERGGGESSSIEAYTSDTSEVHQGDIKQPLQKEYSPYSMNKNDYPLLEIANQNIEEATDVHLSNKHGNIVLEERGGKSHKKFKTADALKSIRPLIEKKQNQALKNSINVINKNKLPNKDNKIQKKLNLLSEQLKPMRNKKSNKNHRKEVKIIVKDKSDESDLTISSESQDVDDTNESSNSDLNSKSKEKGSDFSDSLDVTTEDEGGTTRRDFDDELVNEEIDLQKENKCHNKEHRVLKSYNLAFNFNK